MKILVIGNGGREHALAWKLAQSEHATHIYVAPGNAGTEREDKVSNIDIAVTDIPHLINFAKDNEIELTIVGPELPLSLGVVDEFEAHGLNCLGPKKQCAQLESSKAFSKDFMTRYNIPTARYQNFTEVDKAKMYLKEMSLPVVIKASGLAAGKGVVIAQTMDEAQSTIEDMLEGNRFGDAGCEIVVEEFLNGEEASFIVLCDGAHALAMASSQDHKARDDGDKGPNTGGMGAYSPAPIVTNEVHQQVMQQIIQPVLDGMKNEGEAYKGFLYAGLMIMPNGEIKTLEFNCRFGDPETQPIMMRLESDLVELAFAALNEELDEYEAHWNPGTALGVVMAAGGYPDHYNTGDIIIGLDQAHQTNSKVFHAGTKRDGASIVTNGGRVLCATALGNDIEEAYAHAYKLVDSITWQNEYHRTDIGKKAFSKISIHHE
ncbi:MULTISPECIES: phosphoribosylamine--glycine ligase [Cysteiniphilum]|uniref:Phosphoribosylamine--glycine ligase n=1 Tax=Cysteiniphilum litorale TaxID=2056700 RepID=A0A8J2Z3X6_9GAMM|nr:MULTISPECIES: phosphoribosylamine--glycine ligase [Cysteiniphilum]GGF95624.1 phosphoribosylamine--glycine ligase [Cysteiniphilum litorale]